MNASASSHSTSALCFLISFALAWSPHRRLSTHRARCRSSRTPARSHPSRPSWAGLEGLQLSLSLTCSPSFLGESALTLRIRKKGTAHPMHRTLHGPESRASSGRLPRRPPVCILLEPRRETPSLYLFSGQDPPCGQHGAPLCECVAPWVLLFPGLLKPECICLDVFLYVGVLVG